jgi:outer membrane assembly lipoprotein YfiO
VCLVLPACLLGRAAAGALSPESSPEGLLAAAKRAFDGKQYAQAQALADRLLARHPEAVAAADARLVLIDALTGQGKHLEAFEQCEKFLTAHPETRRRNEILQREFDLGRALIEARGTVLVFSYSRFLDGVRVLEKVIEHAPFGSWADDAVFAIAEAHRERGNFEEARDHYERLLKNYPDSALSRRAVIGRAACNYQLTEGAPYDSKPAEDAAKDLDRLARSAAGGGPDVADRRDALRDTLARGHYESALYYFRNQNVDAGLRYLETVLAKYPDTTYAARARRILNEVILAKFPDSAFAERARRALAAEPPRAANSKEKP